MLAAIALGQAIEGCAQLRPAPNSRPVMNRITISSHSGGRRSQSPFIRLRKVVARILTPPTPLALGCQAVRGMQNLSSARIDASSVPGPPPIKTTLLLKLSSELERAK